MPGLQSFCVATAIGLGATYLLQVSWFVAWLTIDEQRIAAGRDGLLPCVTHRAAAGPTAAAGPSGSGLLGHYIRLLATPPAQLLAVLVSLALACCGVLGWLRMQHRSASPEQT